jgi:threonylcarbamoyladenosine tRNA methylthiotransferase MtaB
VEYEEALRFACQAIPDLAITTDVIAGFPGETSAEFDESYDFCRKMNFAYIHVFPYSRRPGTPAAEMPNQVNAAAKQARVQRMLELAQETAYRFQEGFIGQKRLVLWEHEARRGMGSGLTDNYIRVFTHCDRDLTNHLLPVQLLSITERGMLGKLCEP